MATSKSGRLSGGDLSLSFGAVAFPLHVWAIVNILAIFPAWLLRLSAWEMAGAIGYPLVDALLESGIVWLVLVGLSFALPRKWLAQKFVALSSALVWVAAAWAVLAQFNFDAIAQWGAGQMVPALLAVVLSLGLAYWAVQRFGRVEDGARRLAQRLMVLTYFYLVFDLLGLVVIVLRNL